MLLTLCFVAPIFLIDYQLYSTTPNTRILLKGAGLKEQKQTENFIYLQNKTIFCFV